MEALGFRVAGGEASECSLFLMNPRPDLDINFGGCEDGGGVKLPAELRGGERYRSSPNLSTSVWRFASTGEMVSLLLLPFGEGVLGIAISDMLAGSRDKVFLDVGQGLRICRGLRWVVTFPQRSTADLR